LSWFQDLKKIAVSNASMNIFRKWPGFEEVLKKKTSPKVPIQNQNKKKYPQLRVLPSAI